VAGGATVPSGVMYATAATVTSIVCPSWDSQDLQEALEPVASETRRDVPEGERPAGHFRSVVGFLPDHSEELGYDVVREPRGDERLGPLDRLGRRTLRVAGHTADVRQTSIVETDQTAGRRPTSEGSARPERAQDWFRSRNNLSAASQKPSNSAANSRAHHAIQARQTTAPIPTPSGIERRFVEQSRASAIEMTVPRAKDHRIRRNQARSRLPGSSIHA
jgi:hypothetical protein